MRRITIDEVRAACQATGYRLEQGVTLDRDRKCACPIGVVACFKSAAYIEDIEHAIKELGLDDWYAEGLIDSFDGCRNFLAWKDDEIARYNDGHSDGIAIRQALLWAASA